MPVRVRERLAQPPLLAGYFSTIALTTLLSLTIHLLCYPIVNSVRDQVCLLHHYILSTSPGLGIQSLCWTSRLGHSPYLLGLFICQESTLPHLTPLLHFCQSEFPYVSSKWVTFREIIQMICGHRYFSFICGLKVGGYKEWKWWWALLQTPDPLACSDSLSSLHLQLYSMPEGNSLSKLQRLFNFSPL